MTADSSVDPLAEALTEVELVTPEARLTRDHNSQTPGHHWMAER
jgi:hypothetical protein